MSEATQVPADPRMPASVAKRTKETEDLEASAAILKEGFVCTVAHLETVPGSVPAAIRPKCVPMVYAYREEGGQKLLYLHGSIHWPDPTPPSLKHLWSEGGVPVCVTVTLLDGLVVGRAAISTSLNYRSVAVDGIAKKVAQAERGKTIEALSDQVIPGRWAELRPLKDGPNGEMDSDGKHSPTVGVLSVSLTENATVRMKKHQITQPEHENQDDWNWNHGKAWGGILPIRHTYGPAQPDSHVQQGAAVPDSIQKLIKEGRAG
ncbi:pyridoxamine 5'-phosphate oxidase family protein [Kitasatospora sp. NPDC002543]